MKVRRRAPRVIAITLAFGIVIPADSQADPINSLADIWPSIARCWKPPAGSEGSEITLRFGLTHRGELRGVPMVTHSRLAGAAAIRREFALAAIEAVRRCTPLQVTESFGPVLAGRIITVRFRSPAKRPEEAWRSKTRPERSA